MPRPLAAGSSFHTPRMVPWRDWSEWDKVKLLLFSPDPYLRCQGVQHVAAWRSRERTPHAIEITSQLVEVRLNDVGPAGCAVASPRRGEDELRLAYSIVVIRAVNGLTGHEQKTAYASPVSSLAKNIGLPSWVVDIRHEASHKQLPGLVILRLAADFLVDFLWRRYWAPQEEHLAFMWGAFDQLVSRFKATSETSLTLPHIHSDRYVSQRDDAPHQPVTGKRKRSKSDLRDDGSPAASTAPRRAAPEDDALESTRPADRPFRRGETEVVDSTTAATSSPAACVAASLIAAHDIVSLTTPTALSWALISLLADGGGIIGGEGGGDLGTQGEKGRGQGHLLPRSREKYPTPGYPGVDEREVARRVTGRWATLLNIFHSRWLGFGAALLVRLIEALLRNASRADAGPTRDLESTASSSVSGGSKSVTSQGGLERQSAFIILWARHILSRRWHLRSSDGKSREVLQRLAAESGLSPTFSQDTEASWGPREEEWVDEPAPPEVLHAAFFPLRELRDRCRGVFSLLPARSAPIDLEDDGETAGVDATPMPAPIAAEFVAACNGGEGPRSHWAKASLKTMCDALDAALSGESGSALRHGGGSGANAGAPFRHRQHKHEPAPEDDFGGGQVAHGTSSSAEIARDGHVSKGSESVHLDGGFCTRSEMMDLDTLEKMVASGVLVESQPSMSPKACSKLAPEILGVPTADCSVRGELVGEEGPAKGADVGVGRDIGVGKGICEQGDVGDSRECDVAWQLVEDWTPCAIGTLPGWSTAPLSVSDLPI